MSNNHKNLSTRNNKNVLKKEKKIYKVYKEIVLEIVDFQLSQNGWQVFAIFFRLNNTISF